MSNKTSDKNVGSMEDDIKILENMIEEYENRNAIVMSQSKVDDDVINTKYKK